ncbi:hypothetical protein FEM48_Zijuj01G0319200 [Ziziphus jujuba var. spinosa]|uniref:Uncharacterized protein n=1 Tax=Ziziphus jujuba var. spinosa TaxID=714518 RepID=A0A978W6E2_ZIZJJ|nr:hypothetical protein FEM48_Zijuj01G0319200 [Ziziphus jujuba var. spinosa]
MDPWPRTTSIQINLGYAPLSSTTDSFYAHPTANGITSINENIRRSDHIDREITQREAEIHKIQKEIIDLELASRRTLEAQVRREILLEGELKMQRPEPLKFPSSSSSSSSSTLMHHHCYGGYDQGRLLDETMPSQSLYDSGASNRFSYKRFSEAAVNEVEPPFQRLRNFDGKSSAIAPGIAGLPSSASSGRLLVLYHPDVCRGNNCGVQFHRINEAYDIVMSNLRGECTTQDMFDFEPSYQGGDEPMRGMDDSDWDMWEEWMGWEGAGIRDYTSHINPYI